LALFLAGVDFLDFYVIAIVDVALALLSGAAKSAVAEGSYLLFTLDNRVELIEIPHVLSGLLRVHNTFVNCDASSEGVLPRLHRLHKFLCLVILEFRGAVSSSRVRQRRVLSSHGGEICFRTSSNGLQIHIEPRDTLVVLSILHLETTSVTIFHEG